MDFVGTIVATQLTAYVGKMKILLGWREIRRCNFIYGSFKSICHNKSRLPNCTISGFYGFSRKSLDLALSYKKNGSQRVNVNNTFCLWEEIIAGVPQDSILGSLLFNIFINLFPYLKIKAFLSNYADDNVQNSFKWRSHKNLWVDYKRFDDSQSW